MAGGKQEVIINNKRFVDVTKVTTGGPVYSYAEAVALTQGKQVATSD